MSHNLSTADLNPESAGASPVMAQYFEIKARHADSLLFFRMGDFFELFFQDAVVASAVLGIALTKRGQHQGQDIPMCGVPVHQAERYLHDLIRAGHRVAVCEQLEDPAEAKKRGYKAVVRRDVVRLVTAGTLTEEGLLDARRHNYLVAFAPLAEGAAVAWADISTGDLRVMGIESARLSGVLARLAPREVLVPDRALDEAGLRAMIQSMGAVVTPLGRSSFDSQAGAGRVAALFGASTLDGFGQFTRPEVAALAALTDYVSLTQKGALPALRPPQRENESQTMRIDAATRRNLELTESDSSGRSGTLLGVIDRSCTGAGARQLAEWLCAPLTDVTAIKARQDVVDVLRADADLRQDLRQALGQVPDLARSLSRLSLDRGGPRDLGAVRQALQQAEAMRQRLWDAGRLMPLPMLLQQQAEALGGHAALIDALGAALELELPLLARDGGFIRPGFDPALDQQRSLRDESQRVILEMESQYRGETGIATLKIRHNNVIGYHIEVTALHGDKLMAAPLNGRFIHRQTLANVVRFTTTDLADLEARIARAADAAREMELAHFARLRALVLAQAEAIATTAQALAVLDALAGLAALSAELGWVRPVVDDSRAFHLRGARHPVVEQALKRQGGLRFVPNDCDLGPEGDEARLWLLTGPNMAGKSTFLRQNALLAVLAQMGSHVPAEQAHIGIVDQLFSRVGAADDLARGRSTFMVEMVETAAILNQAGPRALVILDEIGRGTATFDGLSIAWAVVEHLVAQNRCRGLFATHYHELTALAERLPALRNATMRVREWQGEVIFLHEVAAGTADRSYGVQVARLAGLPASVIARAREVLKALESGDGGSGGARRVKAVIDDLPLFAAAAPAPTPARDELRLALAALHPDELTPRAALEALYRLKELAKAND